MGEVKTCMSRRFPIHIEAASLGKTLQTTSYGTFLVFDFCLLLKSSKTLRNIGAYVLTSDSLISSLELWFESEERSIQSPLMTQFAVTFEIFFFKKNSC